MIAPMLGCALALVIAATPAAPSAPPPAKSLTPWHLSVRGDPIVFALVGFSVGVDAAPADSHWRISMAAFHVEVPEVLVPVVVRPPRGVRVIESAVQFGAFYDTNDDHSGLYVGPEFYVYHLDYRVDGRRLEARELYAHVTAGYTWFPFDQRIIFVQPWATVGVPIFHSGGVSDGAIVLEDRAFNWHATVSLGARLF